MVRIFLGIVLIVLSGGSFLVMFADYPPGSTFTDVMTSLYCQSGETFGRVSGDTRSSILRVNGRATNFYCVNNEDQQRVVTERVVLSVVAGFVTSLLVGILLTVSGSLKAVRRKVRVVPGTTGFHPTGVIVHTSTHTSGAGGKPTAAVFSMQGNLNDLPPEKVEKAQQILSQFGFTMPIAGGDGTVTVTTMGDAVRDSSEPGLAEKLMQLKQAHVKGLITDEEYDALRKQVLDDLT